MLEIKDLQTGYGRTRVISGVNITVPDDAVVSILGHNGAGKRPCCEPSSGSLSRPVAASAWTGRTFALKAADMYYVLAAGRVSSSGAGGVASAEHVLEAMLI